MCCSTDHAIFTGTTVYCGRRRHPVHGLIEVFGYQNTAVNLASGPNAMVLHLPAVSVTPGQFLPVGRHSDVLARMVDRIRPVSRGPSVDWMEMGGPQVQVFDHDIYTVALAENAALIPAALGQVRPERRPRLQRELFEFYSIVYPQHTIALCCFDNAEARAAKPLLLWYEPTEPDLIVLPGVDCHSGAAPDLAALVARDHWLVFGTDDARPGWGQTMRYPKSMRRDLREFLPDQVTGVNLVADSARNGDFAIPYSDLIAGNLECIDTVSPL